MSQLYIHEYLVRIQPLVHKILCRQKSVTVTLRGAAPVFECVCVCVCVGGGGGGGGEAIITSASLVVILKIGQCHQNIISNYHS